MLGQVFHFLKSLILQFSAIVMSGILRNVFLRNVKCRDQQGRPTYITLTDKLWISLLNFRSNLTSLRISIKNFTLKYSKKNDFLIYFLFWVSRTLFFMIFRVFRFVLNFRDLSVFSVSPKTCHSRVASLTVPGGQELHVPQISIIFLKLSSFLSSKALATPLYWGVLIIMVIYLHVPIFWWGQFSGIVVLMRGFSSRTKAPEFHKLGVFL